MTDEQLHQLRKLAEVAKPFKKAEWFSELDRERVKYNQEFFTRAHEFILQMDINLIAAAPDLLAACKMALEDGEDYRLSEAVKRELRSAIDKAEGELR